MVYYQTRGDSISKFSYEIWVSGTSVMLEVNNNLVDSHCFENYDEADTSVVEDVKPFNDGKFFVPTFSEQMLEMKECLRVASKDFDISKLKVIGCFLSDFDSVRVAVTSGLMPDIRNNSVDFSTIDKELSKTCLKDSLNSVLCCFNVQVDTINSQEHICFYYKSMPCPDPSTIHDISSPIVIDTELYIRVKHKE